MGNKNSFDVIIIGGSYAGMSAAMALGRSLREVLIIDAGNPCNKKTSHSHNVLTLDGKPPAEIVKEAREQVAAYDTVSWHLGVAAKAIKQQDHFKVETDTGEVFWANKLILATGIKDIMLPIPGFADCWAVSILHCPYCHGYEVKGLPTALIASGEKAFHMAKLLPNWTDDLSLYTNGPSELTDEQKEILAKKKVVVMETPIQEIIHTDGILEKVLFSDGSSLSPKVMYAALEFTQHSTIANDLGCAVNEGGLLVVDGMQKTTVEGVYACGDNSGMRFLSAALASGTKAGAIVNFELINERF